MIDNSFLTNEINLLKSYNIFDTIIIKKVNIQELVIEQGDKTPQVDFNPYSGELIISGKSIPENAAGFYDNLIEWIYDYIKNPRLTTNLRLNLDYFNSASSIWLARIIKYLCSVKKNGFTLFIHLYFDIEEFDTMLQDDLKEAISPFMDMIGSPSVSIGIKIYGTDNRGTILRESTVLI